MWPRSALVCLALSGCACPVPIASHLKPVIEVQTDVVVHVERVPAHIPAAKLRCPANPEIPFLPSTKARDVYDAALLGVADQCRANLEALGRRGAP